MNEMEYTKNLWKKIEKVYDYYEHHDTIDFLQRIMAFIDECLDFIDEPLFLIPKTEINDFRNRARRIWTDNGSAEKLELLRKEYDQLIGTIKPFEELLKTRKEYAVFGAVGWYLSNYHDNPANQFTHDFIELFISELQRAGIAEEEIEKKLTQHFKGIIDTWTVEYSEYN